MIYGSWNIRWDRREFVHFGPFCALSPPWQPRKSKFWKIEKKIWRYYIITLHCYWDTTHDGSNFCLSFSANFALLPTYNPKNENFYKMKTMFRYIILYMCTKNYDHMMYSSWDMVHKGWMDRWTGGQMDCLLNHQLPTQSQCSQVWTMIIFFTDLINFFECVFVGWELRYKSFYVAGDYGPYVHISQCWW